ncbi:MAG: outer membrane beta-barrel protein [bacterium]|nr:outer membrane beta-barrel protein [bacterium]
MFKKFRSLFVIAIILGSAIPTFAQNTIKGRVTDESGEPLIYATIAMLSPADSTVQYYGIADKDGKYEIKYIKSGRYLIQYSYVGMEITYEEAAIPAPAGEDFGTKVLKTAANVQEVIEISADRIPIQFKKDTVVFDAKAFKVRTGAVVEDLLKKIPGIEVDKTGNMKALGEDVTKVLVDGKEFFSGDPKVATKNLPSDAIDKVEVFDKRSDEAEFMGIDDGIQDRTINLLLNEDARKGYFGNVDGGGGTVEHHKAKGDLYRFSSKLQNAVLGMHNNINEFGFSGPKGNQFGQQVSGLNTSGAGGINMMYNPTRFNRYFASYLFTSTKTKLLQNTSTENFLEDGSYFQDSDMNQVENNKPHSLRFGMNHRFGTKHQMIIRGAINTSSNNSVTQTLTNTNLDDSPVNSLDNSSDNRSDQTGFYFNGNDIIKLRDATTQLKTNLFASYSNNTSELDYTNITTIYGTNSTLINDHYRNDKTGNLSFNVNPTLVQKVNPYWYLTAGVNMGSKKRDLDRRQEMSGTLIDSLSADFNTRETSISPSISLQRSVNKSWFTFNLGARWINFDKMLSSSSLGKSDYFFFTPRISYKNLYREGRRIEAGYNMSTGIPGLTQLLPVTNTINQISLYQGNPGLKPEQRHNLNFAWSYFDQFSFTSFFTRLTARYTKDKFSTSQTVNDDLTKTITPVNVKYNYMLSLNSNFSTPIRALGLIVNLKSNEIWSRGLSIVNSEDNIQTVFSHSLDVNFENRGQGDLNFSVGGSVSRTSSKYSIAEAMNNVYYNTTYYTDIYYTPNDQWTFGTEANVVSYNSDSFSGTETIPLINASISYFFLEGGKMGLVLYGYDLLEKFTNFQQTNGLNYIMEQDKNALGRYVMLSLRLRFGSGIGRGFSAKMR